MSSIFKSSIGRKLIMSLSGMFLVLFLLFHMSMNLVALFSAEAYNAVCGFLGTNWYALAGTSVLAFGFLVHIVYAFVLTIQNRRARGNDRYAVTDKPATVEWASQNMLVLGIIVLLGLVLHLSDFWYNMMYAELTGAKHQFLATDGGAWLSFKFGQWPIAIAYIIWIVAIWFHLSHGFWSMFQTIGWSNLIWLERWQCIAKWFTSIVCAGFAVVVLGFALGLAPLCDSVEGASKKLIMQEQAEGHHFRGGHHDMMMGGRPECERTNCEKPCNGKPECNKQNCDKPTCPGAPAPAEGAEVAPKQ